MSATKRMTVCGVIMHPNPVILNTPHSVILHCVQNDNKRIERQRGKHTTHFLKLPDSSPKPLSSLLFAPCSLSWA